MRLSLNEFLELKRRKPQLFGVGSVSSAEPEPAARRKRSPKDSSKSVGKECLVVSLVGFRQRLLDGDNFVGACKALRDAIANTLHVDDGDKRITWQYQQIQTCGDEGILVRIELREK